MLSSGPWRGARPPVGGELPVDDQRQVAVERQHEVAVERGQASAPHVEQPADVQHHVAGAVPTVEAPAGARRHAEADPAAEAHQRGRPSMVLPLRERADECRAGPHLDGPRQPRRQLVGGEVAAPQESLGGGQRGAVQQGRWQLGEHHAHALRPPQVEGGQQVLHPFAPEPLQGGLEVPRAHRIGVLVEGPLGQEAAVGDRRPPELEQLEAAGPLAAERRQHRLRRGVGMVDELQATPVPAHRVSTPAAMHDGRRLGHALTPPRRGRGPAAPVAWCRLGGGPRLGDDHDHGGRRYRRCRRRPSAWAAAGLMAGGVRSAGPD